MKASERLLQRLRNELKIDLSPAARIVRSRAGHWQKSCGAWLWWVEDERRLQYHVNLGSQERVRDLVRCPNLTRSNEHSGVNIDCGCKGRCAGIPRKERT